MTLDIEKAFGEGANENFLINYLDKLLENWREGERTLTRNMLFATVLATTFVLLSLSGIGEVSIFGIKVTNFQFIELGIPLVISYLVYSAVNILLWITVIGKTYDKVFRFLQPKAFKEDFEQPAHPHGSVIMYLVTGIALKESSPFVANVSYYSGILRVWLLIGIPLAFEVYAGYSLVADPPYEIVSSVVVISLMGILTMAAAPILYGVIKE